jgi:hypothetical protein
VDYYCDLSIVIHVTDSAGIDIYNTGKRRRKKKRNKRFNVRNVLQKLTMEKCDFQILRGFIIFCSILIGKYE